MNEEKNMRLSQVARKLNVGTDTIVSFLLKKGFSIENNPNSKITTEQFGLLTAEFLSAGIDKKEAAHVTIRKSYATIAAPASNSSDSVKIVDDKVQGHALKKHTTVTPERAFIEEKTTVKEYTSPKYASSIPILSGIKTIGKVDLSPKTTPKVKPISTPVVTDTQKKESKEAPLTVPDTTKELPPIDIPVDKSDLDLAPKNVEHDFHKKKINFDQSSDLKRPTVVGKMTLSEISYPKKRDKDTNVTSKVETKSYASPTSSASKSVPLSETSRHQKSRKGNTANNGRFSEITKKSATAKFIPAASHQQINKKEKEIVKEGISSQEIEGQIKKTLAKISKATGDTGRSKYKKDKRSAILEAASKRQRQEQEEAKILKITEFISANELASFMGVSVNEVISTCMTLGMIISINQRLDAETITVVADEFGYSVEFVDVRTEEAGEEIEDVEGELVERPPIVTIMGHVDHGKTSLLDYIRATKMVEKEAGGITQHIGAYDIVTDNNKRIVFLDTPGHEAFTAMRTRGAKVTDIIVIVVAADDSVMNQTKEAISHAQVAGCPIIIAINKIDKPQSNPEKVKEDLANNNILVEDWGGKYQCQEISAKTGQGVNELLEKILLEASFLELKATPAWKAKGTIVESFLDPGRGYIATGIVQDGTLHVGDVIFAGVYYGKVRAMLNHQGIVRKTAPPATPVQVLGLNGAPRAGDTFRVMSSIKEAGEWAQKRQQLLREQTLRTKSHVTLDEIGRRLAVGNFKELNLIIKGDVDGSIEALADSLLKLAHEEVQVNIIHKCVGAVSESDILLAAAAEAIVISFHMKLSAQAKKLAEKEGVEIKQYAIIYDAINDIRLAVQDLLAPTIEEVNTGRAEVKKIFPISKIGNIAGCQVQTGFIKQSNPVRVIRKDEIIYTGPIYTIKHGLEEVKQVKSVSECGIHIKNFNDIEVGDIIEGFERKQIKRKLE
ncbi:translation initiation factor IF-2 [Cardinium endosymbiont of Culicoides punctatus]|uniref:translation initiation factor IF-2 n=1 Tax=Cardinium endosymbiont of Culicoides punctatus TaxID=2304601 RepID=UPI0010585A66|nr:translation initiation factor IF-2 [Cardinium endosymbiont of Culicoides punctatus]TDG95673.1 Translation initiation factor IF-2 [Cardinium endosymbiont of Culicoides punctatus]